MNTKEATLELLFLAHLLDEDLGNVSVVVESSQMKGREAVFLFNVHQLSSSSQDLFCGPEGKINRQLDQSQLRLYPFKNYS